MSLAKTALASFVICLMVASSARAEPSDQPYPDQPYPPGELNSKSDDAHSDKEVVKPLSIGRYISGGLVGSVVGFGLGHSIIGEWHRKGWLFTFGEGACIATAAVALSVDAPENDATPAIVFAGALGAFTLLRIYQIRDIWVHPFPRLEHNNTPTVAVGPLSDKGHWGATLQWRW